MSSTPLSAVERFWLLRDEADGIRWCLDRLLDAPVVDIEEETALFARLSEVLDELEGYDFS
jgi:hypothetical protein